MSLKILIAESQEVLRAGLRTILISDTRVSEVYEATNEKDLQWCLVNNDPDLIVVNQDLLTDISILQTRNFVMLADELNMNKLRIAYEYGAHGYLSVNVSAELLRIMLCPEENAFLIEPIVAPILMAHVFNKKRIFSPINEALLTPREKEIACLLCEGYDRPSIANQLCIAETTLKTHIKNIAKKRSTAVYSGRNDESRGRMDD